MDFSRSLHQRFELNNFLRNDELERLQQAIYNKPNCFLYLYTTRAFVIQGYRKLCFGEIELDEFFRFGDVDGETSTTYTGYVLESCDEVIQYQNIYSEYFRDSFIVITSAAKAFFVSNGGSIQQLSQRLGSVGATMFVI